MSIKDSETSYLSLYKSITQIMLKRYMVRKNIHRSSSFIQMNFNNIFLLILFIE